MRVFLTGGTGLLGSHLAEELRRLDREVVALHRRGADTSFLEEHGCSLVEGDVRDEPASLAVGMARCTHVVHSAALVYAGGAWPKVRAVNVDGTRNVLSAAAMAGIGHALHVSSVAVYGSQPGPVDETSPVDTDVPPNDLYARSKREAEEVARGIEAKRSLPVTILRPAAVYGERDRLMAPAIAGMLGFPIAPLFGPADNSLPVVYAGNVASAMRLTLEAGRGGTTFDVGLDHPLTQRDFLSHLAEGMGRSPRFVSIPAGLIRGSAALFSRMGVSTPGAKHVPLDRVVRLALGENPFRSTHIRTELGWDPPHAHADALQRTGRWLVTQQ
ncbi:MAG: NAD-dependent epimerase/dehydratase family protein [Gemmatimonadetes bacterium]|nr:NAD-dependent epimerase/dehydratase family protein [Gemmatimonadota bacterium]MDA1102145.1 NAD-dependent epimerase/dehydratase family protein [Gemmatimonadota bacterium]